MGTVRQMEHATESGAEAAADQGRTARPGTRRTGSRRIVQRAVVEAAVELFKQRGFHAVTVTDIADHVGIARRTFFLHFASKDDVLIAWLDDEWEKATEVLLTQTTAETPFDAYCTALRGLVAHLDQVQEHARAVTAIILSTPSLFGRQLARQHEWATTWATALRTLDGKSHEHAMSYEVDAAAAFSIIIVAAQRWIDDPENTTFRAWLDQGFLSLRKLGSKAR